MEVAECLNTCFTNITNSLDIEPAFKVIPEQLQTKQIVIRAIEKFKIHKSICIIKERLHVENNSFQFFHVNAMEVMRQIESLDKRKSDNGGIPNSRKRSTKRIVCPYLIDCINSTILDCKFPDELKTADSSPISKGYDPTSKVNFRPISVLSSTSKIHESMLKDQMFHYFKDKLRDILYCFMEGCSSKHAIIIIIE